MNDNGMPEPLYSVSVDGSTYAVCATERAAFSEATIAYTYGLPGELVEVWHIDTLVTAWTVTA